MNYYTDFPEYLTNSQLSAHKMEVFGIEQTDKQEKVMKKAFFDGGLFDDCVTWSVEKRYTFVPDSYQGVRLSKENISNTKLMIEALKRDSASWRIIENSIHQKEFYRNKFSYTHLGIKGTCKFKGKLDFYFKQGSLVSDLKSTACTSQKSFEQAVFHFGYDRQGCGYMDLSGCDKYLIIAVSKKNHKVFKFAFTRDSEVFRNAAKKRDSLIFSKIVNSS